MQINLDRLPPVVAGRFRPFAEEIVAGHAANIHSVHVVGSAVTADFDEKTSDINSVVVLRRMDLKFVEFIAPLGRKFGKKGVAAPLIMTPEYIARSLDVFPIEFYDFMLIHDTVCGDDIFSGIEIQRSDLRQQCEREIKAKLIGLRQGYISSLGDRQILTERFTGSIAGYMPLFRGIIFLLGKEPPVTKSAVIEALSQATGIDAGIFRVILDIRRGVRKLSADERDSVFERYYEATEKIGEVVDGLQV